MAGCTLYTCNHCKQRLFARNFAPKTIRDKTYICRKCEEILKTHHRCFICEKDLPNEEFPSESLTKKVYICNHCYPLMEFTCKICNKSLPRDAFTKESIEKKHYICIKCQPEAKRIAHDDIMNAYTSNLKYEATNTLYIYHNPNNFRQLNHYTIINGDKSPITRHNICPSSYTWDQVMYNKELLLNAYANVLIEVLSSPIPIFHAVKIDNGEVIQRLIIELKSEHKTILSVLQSQHNFLIYKYNHEWWY